MKKLIDPLSSMVYPPEEVRKAFDSLLKLPADHPCSISNNGKVKIEFVDYSGKQRIKAPLKRRFWYFVTLGKWGDLYHYKHVPMRKYYPVLDNRTSYAHQMLYGKPVHRDYDFLGAAIINCRCSMKPIKEK
jgi:hypothetical protein